MKKILLIAIAALMTTGAFAQKFEWGVKAGLNLANVSDMKIDGVSNSFRPGIHVGAFAEYVVNDFFGVQAELLYSMQGIKQKISAEGIKIKSTSKVDYINLPILAKFYILDRLSIDVGPQFGYMISGKDKISGIPSELEDELGENGTHNFYDEDGNKKFDVSVGLGLTYKFAFRLDVFARFNLGLTKLADTGKQKNNVLQLGVGYRF